MGRMSEFPLFDAAYGDLTAGIVNTVRTSWHRREAYDERRGPVPDESRMSDFSVEKAHFGRDFEEFEHRSAAAAVNRGRAHDA
jgi:hypothetical protein